MALNVEVEIIVTDHWIGGERVVEGQRIAVSPVSAAKLIDRGFAKKVGVVEAKAEEEADESEEVGETTLDDDAPAENDDDTVGSDA